MYSLNNKCDISEELWAVINTIIYDAANREISQWVTDQRNTGGLLRDDVHFETLESRLLGRIYLGIDEIEVIFLSASKERELVAALFRTIKDRYAQAVKEMVSNYRENMLSAEDRLLDDAASEFNDFMMKGK